MPICYEIDIAIVRIQEGEEPYQTTLPRTIRTPNTLTNEEIAQEVETFWQQFITMLFDSDPIRAAQYARTEGYEVTNVYRC